MNLRLEFLIGTALTCVAMPAFAQDAVPSQREDAASGEIVVNGIRKSLQDAIETKRRADSIVDVISAEDVGKLADSNVAESLARLPGRKLVFTNGDAPYATRVLDRLGLGATFEAIHDVHATGYRPKPDPLAYRGLCDAYGLDPAHSLFVEDMARNLKPAKAIGMTRLTTLRRIVLPQAMRVIIPPVGNEVISMVKLTSVASVIQFSEILRNAQTIYYANARVIELLIVAAGWYLIVVTLLQIGQYFLERHFSKGRGERRAQRAATTEEEPA